MAKYVKVGGTWRTVSPDTDSVQTAYVKVGGTWLGVTNAYVKVAGTWRSIFTYSSFVVPNVVGQVLATGRANITNSGNTPGTNTILNNANGATPTNNGTISTQSVVPGTYLSAQTVNLSYYVFAFITVRNILGQTAASANSLITTDGNTVGSVLYTSSGATANNHATVASQTIPAATNYTTAQVVGYTLYNYTVPTPSQPSVSLVGTPGTNTFTFSTSFGANTTSALAYWGPPGQAANNFAGNVTFSGQSTTVTGLSANTDYSFTAYPVNTQTVNTIGNQSVTGSPATAQPVRTANLPAPTGGTVTLNGTGVVDTTVTASASGFTNSPISYNVYITTSTSGDPTSGLTPLVSSNGESSVSFVVSAGQATTPANRFRAFATATNAGGTSTPVIQSSNVITASFPPPTGPNPPTGVRGENDRFPIGGTFYWIRPNPTGATGQLSYTWNIYTSGGSYVTGGAGNGDVTSIELLQAGTFYIQVRSFDNGTGLQSSIAQSANVIFTGTAGPSAPSITASNNYNGGSPNSWTLTVYNTGGAATSFNWGLQFSNSDGGSVLASTTGSGGSIPANGSATVTRNSSTYSWARWVNISATGAGGSSNTIAVADNGWE
jgi:hypothetical protein